MKLSDLTDSGAVLAAIAEFDRLEQKRFLQKYGFHTAKSYFLVYDGKRYDSKAIVGAALGFQYPEHGPLSPKDFSGGEATVSRKLEDLGFTVERISDAPFANPKWTRDETILALELYVKNRPNLPNQTHPDIIALSSLLQQYGRMRGIVGNSAFRNPSGISMNIANLSRLDSDDKRAGLEHGAKIQEQVWEEFMPPTAALTNAAAELRAKILSPGFHSDGARHTGEQAENEREIPVSRGPRPSFGEVTHVSCDGQNSVYVMQLHGPVADIFPTRNLEKMGIVKIGRTNNTDRRINELNCGFPPGSNVFWKCATSKTLPSADLAHDLEQNILRRLSELGLTIGREFAIVPQHQISDILQLVDDANLGKQSG